MQLVLAILAARLSICFIRLFRLGEATSLPGKIAAIICPNIFQKLCRQIREGVILISGTNGKSTTSLLLSQMFSDKKVIHNKSGANFENGLVTSLLDKTKLPGKIQADFAVFEVDEFALVLILKKIRPLAIVTLNLFRDQLDRYGEMQTILHSWKIAMADLPINTHIFINADDPALCHLGKLLPHQIHYFGLNEPNCYLQTISHAMDSIYCPQCDHLLSYKGLYLSHLGDYSCRKCDFAKKQPVIDSRHWPKISNETYNKYNTMAAVAVAQKMGVDQQKITTSIHHFKPVFGRGETVAFKEKKILLLLSKNPVSLNEMIMKTSRIIDQGQAHAAILALNDLETDGTDISWIWDADFEPIVQKNIILVLSGTRAHELSLRIKYSANKNRKSGQIEIEKDLRKALFLGLKHTPKGAFLPILPTYTAMLKMRKILVGHKFH